MKCDASEDLHQRRDAGLDVPLGVESMLEVLHEVQLEIRRVSSMDVPLEQKRDRAK